MPSPIQPGDLVLHFLNVGHGDGIVVEFPEDANGDRSIAIVDSNNGTKMRGYLRKLNNARPFTRIEFVCATHPHQDHIRGIQDLLNGNPTPLEFWDSGFRHNSRTYKGILETVSRKGIRMQRISSGMETYYGQVRITALSPSVALRNRYATYGVDMNNASIVLRLEHCTDDVVKIQSLRYTGVADPDLLREASRAVVILAGDAEFDSWAQITEEYPKIERDADDHQPLVRQMVNLLNCSVVKVAHHGSMHSSPLEVYERMTPSLAIISNKQKMGTIRVGGTTRRRGKFPHDSSKISLEEVGARVLTTDGSYATFSTEARAGSVVVVVPPGQNARYKKLGDGSSTVPNPPTNV